MVRNKSLDALKAISIIFVFIWHTRPILYKSTSSALGVTILVFAQRIFYLEITTIAVPVFLIVSLFLFSLKLSTDHAYLMSRIKRLSLITLFWMTLQFFLYYLLTTDRSIPDLNLWARLLLTGGPNLPIAGGSVFYYLVVLIFLVVVSYFYPRKHTTANTVLSLLLITGFLIYFEYAKLSGNNIPYWRMDNFLIYIPTIYLLKHEMPKLSRLTYIFFLFFAAFIIHDLYLGLGGNIYASVSVYLGAVSLFLYCYNKTIHLSKMGQFLSTYTLGIFALHKYMLIATALLANHLFIIYPFPQYVTAFNIEWGWLYFVISTITAVLTLLLTYLLSLTSLKRFVC